MATTYWEFSRISLTSSACDSDEIAPSMNATSSPASEFFVLSAFTYLNSTTLFHLSRWSFRSSVKRIVLSSQQVKENQPTTRRPRWPVPPIRYGDRSVDIFSPGCPPREDTG